MEQADGATWRPSVPFRIQISVTLAPFSAVIGFLVWVSLPTGGLPTRWFVVLAVPLWLWLVYRAWTLSATLTPDALIARGLLSAKRIPLTGITAVGFSSRGRGPWAPLTVTAQDRRREIWAVQKNEYTRPDRRGEADDAADAIRAAAAL
ncbi:MAG TPA: hypothetical protein VHT26_19265 [Trebonia sp.]|nr:hypothetical protein [Trebonia sp.]